MKKVLLIGATAVVVGGLLYYPTYRAPKAHEIIEQQLANMNSKLTAENLGELKIQKHETDKDGSHVELEIELAIPEEYRMATTRESIVLTSVLDIDFGFLPTSKGFKSIHSTTTSPDINGALAETGNLDGLTLTCDTTPESKGYEAKCSTNALTLKNDKTQATDQEVGEITLSESNIHLITNDGGDRLSFDWTIPSFQILDQGKALANISNTKLTSTMPIDPEGKISVRQLLLGEAVIDGQSSSSFSIESISVTPPQSQETVEINNAIIASEGEVKDGLMSGFIKMDMPEMKGMPMDIKSLSYGATLDKMDANFFMAVQKAYDDYQAQIQPNQQEIIDQAASFLAAGPQIGFNVDLAQHSGDDLTVKANLKINESDIETAKQILTSLNPSRMAANENLALFLQNGEFTLDAKADQALAEMLAATVTSGPYGGGADPEAQRQAAAQGLAMLEMFGVIARNEDGFTAQFEANDKGVMVNGQDFSPMLGLPARQASTQTQQTP